MVRSYFDYASTVWSPYKVKYIEMIEGVQRRATKLLPCMKDLEYPDRLKALKLPSLAYRRVRGDMIETYKILMGLYDEQVTAGFLKLRKDTCNRENLRGHPFTLTQERALKSKRKNFFSVRITKIWNSLPVYVIEAPSLNSFKNRLDKYWGNQDLMYDFKATRDLSRHTLEEVEEDGGIEEDRLIEDPERSLRDVPS
jgi:hypothetical protein